MMLISTHGIVSTGYYDSDAQALIGAILAVPSATLSPLERQETHVIFRNLKGTGPNNNVNIFSLIDRLWLLLGGVSAAMAIDIRLNTGVFSGGGWTYTSKKALSNGSTSLFNSNRTDTDLGAAPGMFYMTTQSILANGSSGCVNNAYTSRLAIQKIFTGASYRNSALSNESNTDTVATGNNYIHTMREPGNSTHICDTTESSQQTNKVAAAVSPTGTNVYFGGMVQTNGVTGVWDLEHFSAKGLTSGMTATQARALRTCMLRFKTALGK